MSQQEPARVSVRIMEKEYVVACPYEERSALLDAAEFLNARMREIRDSGKVVGTRSHRRHGGAQSRPRVT